MLLLIGGPKLIAANNVLKSLTMQSLLARPLTDDALVNRTLAEQIDSVAKRVFHTDLHIDRIVQMPNSTTVTKPGTVLSALMAMFQPKHLQAIGRAMAGDPAMQRDMPRVASAVVGVVQDLDAGRLESVDDVFGTLSRVDGIDRDALGIARDVLQHVFSGEPSDVGDIVQTAVERAAAVRKVRGQKAGAADCLGGLKTLRPLLSARLLRTVDEVLLVHGEGLARSVDRLETDSEDDMKPDWTRCRTELKGSYDSFAVLASVGVAMVKQPIGDVAAAIHSIAVELAAVCQTTEAASGRQRQQRAVRKVAIAVRRLLRAVLKQTRNIEKRCALETTSPDRIDAAVALNAMAAMLAGTMPALRIGSRIVAVRVRTLREASGRAVLVKVSSALRRVVELLAAGERRFAREASTGGGKVVAAATMQRSVQHVLVALERIGRIFAFK